MCKAAATHWASASASPTNLPWSFDANGPTSIGTTPGAVSGVGFSVVDDETGGAQCSFDITGKVPAEYENGAQQLRIFAASPDPETDSELIVGSVGGGLCPLLIADGDKASIQVAVTISASAPAYDPVHIVC